MATRGVEPASKTCLVGVQARIPSLPAPSQDARHSLQRRLAGVRAPVYLQVVLPLEGFATGLTGEFTDTWGKREAEGSTLGEGAVGCLCCAAETRQGADGPNPTSSGLEYRL